MSSQGGVACGEGMVFNGFSRPDNSGALQALSMDTGDRLWEKSFPAAIHNAPAVGRLRLGCGTSFPAFFSWSSND